MAQDTVVHVPLRRDPG